MSLLALLSRAYLPPRSFSIPTRAAAPRLCTDGGDVKGEEDWRDVRARLVAMEQLEQADPDAPPGLSSPVVSGAPVYETPLIERGSVILGGTQQEFGFALRQQYFHKSVMLLLQHDDAFTRGIILNRPSAMELDGWRVWFGGDVAEGGLFHGNGRAGGTREIVCLHSLTSDAATRLSMPVIRGVQYTTLEGAQALVASGEAERSSFWLFVGYAGWAPKQLQGEVRQHLVPRPALAEPARAEGGDGEALAGRVLCSGRGTDTYTLESQFLHKSLLLLLHETEQGLAVAAVLNRPTANVVQFNLPDRPRRAIGFGGEARVRGGSLDVDGNGLLWLHTRGEALGGTPVGECGVWRIKSSDAGARIKEGEGFFSDFLLLSGVVGWERPALEARLARGELEQVASPALLWPQIWALGEVSPGGEAGSAGAGSVEAAPVELSDGTAIWYAALQQGAGGGDEGFGASLGAVPPSALADEALQVWLHFFAGHPMPEAAAE
ncbi:hypothetical protein EMIHUDRAFT_453551 [Emiliania huxleyi CCMP1516]|uniref:Transcriptional regulator n=2 Tax=Emiliania huxleyi TaxID=2903 RepID=A0A0D3I3T0_EMIH1|nr:hypothetical protein EMIHUDRAFT_453551 [Emiliania huxleyi CCMP1516]EOD05915.1 hypothetical protein EMIHUDRAFT_453551 [Emiliania huxleyi CCMP1516]|eukprot:XP_005758344.1 hypothetical protein EMIHUDRAFT_453551 [Emiliania huxleyi CCMP1516]